MSGSDEWNNMVEPDERISRQDKPSAPMQLNYESAFAVGILMIWTGVQLLVVTGDLAYLLTSVLALFAGIAMYFLAIQHVWAVFPRRCTVHNAPDRRAFIPRFSPEGRTRDSDPIAEDIVLKLAKGRNNAVWFATTQRRQMFSKNRETRVGFDRYESPLDVCQLPRTVQRGDA